jgi:uncharacterized protein YerC
MSRKTRAAAELFNKGLTYVDVATALGISRAAAANRIHRARVAGMIPAEHRPDGRPPVIRMRIVEMVKAGRSKEDIAADTGSSVCSVETQIYTAIRRGELPRSARRDERERAENGNVLGKVDLSGKPCAKCELRGSHVCLPGLEFYATARQEAA